MNEHVKNWILKSGFSYDKMGEDLLVYTTYEEPFLVVNRTMFCQHNRLQEHCVVLSKHEIEEQKRRAKEHHARLLYFLCIQHPKFGFLKYLVPEFSLIFFEKSIDAPEDQLYLVIDELFMEKLPLGFIALTQK